MELEIVLVNEVSAGFRERKIFWVGVFGLEVEVEVAVDTKVQGVHVAAGIHLSRRSKHSIMYLRALTRTSRRVSPSPGAC